MCDVTDTMSYQDCIDLCKSKKDKPLQIGFSLGVIHLKKILTLGSNEQADIIIAFVKEKCENQKGASTTSYKIWMGYKSENEKHFWIDDSLEFSTPVPKTHVDAVNEAGCDYFAEDYTNLHFPYFEISNSKVDCKAHSKS